MKPVKIMKLKTQPVSIALLNKSVKTVPDLTMITIVGLRIIIQVGMLLNTEQSLELTT